MIPLFTFELRLFTMLIPQSLFYFILILFSLFFGVPVFALLSRKGVPRKISVIAGIFVIAIVVLFFNSITSNVIIIENKEASRYFMYGTTSYDLSDGTTVEIEALEDGEFVINNTDFSCVIERSDYRDYEVDDDFLTDILILVPPQSYFKFPNEDIDYLFRSAPEKIKVSKRKSTKKLVRFEIRPLTKEDSQNYLIYKGAVAEGKPNGEGILRIDSLSNYNGGFKDGLRQGEGTEKYSDGATYIGAFLDGKRNGYGELTYSDSVFYKGHWKNDEKSGKGEVIYSNGDHYTGDFRNNKAEGEGTLLFENGDYYEGSFVDGKFQGQGIYFYASGNTLEGNWENGAFATEKSH